MEAPIEYTKVKSESERAIDLNTKAKFNVLTPAEIAEYIHSEFTPYSAMGIEDGKKHLATLIQRYANHFFKKKMNAINDIAQSSM